MHNYNRFYKENHGFGDQNFVNFLYIFFRFFILKLYINLYIIYIRKKIPEIEKKTYGGHDVVWTERFHSKPAAMELDLG